MMMMLLDAGTIRIVANLYVNYDINIINCNSGRLRVLRVAKTALTACGMTFFLAIQLAMGNDMGCRDELGIHPRPRLN